MSSYTSSGKSLQQRVYRFHHLTASATAQAFKKCRLRVVSFPATRLSPSRWVHCLTDISSNCSSCRSFATLKLVKAIGHYRGRLNAILNIFLTPMGLLIQCCQV